MDAIQTSMTNFNYNDLLRAVAPEPSGWAKFGRVLTGFAGSLPMLGGVFSGLGVEGTDRQMQLLMLQQQMQERSQAYQAVSNVSKAEHEAAMSAIRNIK